jgi:hypothetical protein
MDRSLGTLFIRTEKASEEMEPQDGFSLSSQGVHLGGSKKKDAWDYLGEARGQVFVARGKELLLRVGEDRRSGSRDLSALALLRPNDLQSLDLSYGRIIDDSDLSYIVKLTGLRELDLSGVKMSDIGLSYVRELRSLRVLDLSYTEATDGAFVYLKSILSLKALDLAGTRVSDAGLEHLDGLKSLEALDIGHTAVGSVGLAHIQSLVSLRVLDLGGTRTTDSGLIHLEGLRHLEVLGLANTEIGDAGVAHLKGLVSLKTLYLRNTRITDSGLSYLRGITSLRTLELGRNRITNAGLKCLEGLTSLEMLDIFHTTVSDSAVADLSGALPECLIIYDWIERFVTRAFQCSLFVLAVVFLALPRLNKKMIEGKSRVTVFLISSLAGLLVWFFPVLLSEILATSHGNSLKWYGEYSYALALGLIFGMGIFFQHTIEVLFAKKFRNLAGMVLSETVIGTVLPVFIYAAFWLAFVWGRKGSFLFFPPMGLSVSVMIGAANGHIHRRLASRVQRVSE